ncbi:29727_t:CDS:2, partial [Gigaspora margarita]
FEHAYYDSDNNSDDYSLSLRSISNSSSSKHQTKRFIESYFQGGEGIATYINGILEVHCSAGFSAINHLNLSQKYLITSARCLPYNTQEIYHAMWNSPINQEQFGVLRNYQSYGADYALIEKFNNTYKLNPFIRDSLFRIPGNEPPFLLIDYFNYVGVPIPVGDVVCISGYESQVKCGIVTNTDVSQSIKSLRPGISGDHFLHMMKISIDGYLSDRNRGGTAFSIGNAEYPYLF